MTGRVHNYVADFGGLNANWGPTASQVLVYPASGQKNASTTWLALEIPNPLPDLAGKLVGYPISIQAASRAQLGITTFTLNDSKAATVSGRLITTRTDSGQALRTHGFWIPLAPLVPSTTYTAAVTGTLNSAPMNLSWSFTTAPTTTLTAVFSTNTLAATPGTTVEVKLSGGSGYGVELIGSSSSYFSYTGQNPNNPVFATVVYKSPSSAIITRTATACDPVVFSSCRFVMFGTDSSGVSVNFSIAVK